MFKHLIKCHTYDVGKDLLWDKDQLDLGSCTSSGQPAGIKQFVISCQISSDLAKWSQGYRLIGSMGGEDNTVQVKCSSSEKTGKVISSGQQCSLLNPISDYHHHYHHRHRHHNHHHHHHHYYLHHHHHHRVIQWLVPTAQCSLGSVHLFNPISDYHHHHHRHHHHHPMISADCLSSVQPNLCLSFLLPTNCTALRCISFTMGIVDKGWWINVRWIMFGE